MSEILRVVDARTDYQRRRDEIEAELDDMRGDHLRLTKELESVEGAIKQLEAELDTVCLLNARESTREIEEDGAYPIGATVVSHDDLCVCAICGQWFEEGAKGEIAYLYNSALIAVDFDIRGRHVVSTGHVRAL